MTATRWAPGRSSSGSKVRPRAADAPRIEKKLEVTPAPRTLSADFLKARGVADPKVQITRILRVDLDGDGEEEVLISATNYFTEDKSDHSAAPFPEAPIESPRPGSYSIVILRRVVGGKVQTQLVAGEIYAKTEPVAAHVYNVAAVLDLNGDGKLEVIVDSFYYEGGQTTIYRCQPDKIEEVLSVECGV